MGTDDRPPTVDRRAVFADLASAIRSSRGGGHAREMATALFRYAAEGATLVALDGGGERAVFYDPNARTLTAIPFDEHGPDHPAAEQVLTRLSDPAAWIDARGDDLEWIHPRYRRARVGGRPGRR